MAELKITVTEEQLERWEKEAKKRSKNLEQFVIDRVEGVPHGYTMECNKLIRHIPETEKIKDFFGKAEPIVSKEVFDEAMKKLENNKTFEDVRKYVEKKGVTEREINRLVSMLKNSFDEPFDETTFNSICESIDHQLMVREIFND